MPPHCGTAANRGVAAVAQPYVLVMNPDVEVGPGSLSALVAALERDPGLAAGTALPFSWASIWSLKSEQSQMRLRKWAQVNGDGCETHLRFAGRTPAPPDSEAVVGGPALHTERMKLGLRCFRDVSACSGLHQQGAHTNGVNLYQR